MSSKEAMLRMNYKIMRLNKTQIAKKNRKRKNLKK
jgi:hypothetical protein